MHTLELDDDTYERLMKYAEQAGKTPAQWLQERIAQVQNKSHPIGLAKDKGVPLPDAFFEPLPSELLTAFSGTDRPITELVGKAPGGFKEAPEASASNREGRNAKDDSLYRNYKGEPITAGSQNFPDLSEFHKSFPKQKTSAGEFCRQMRDEDRY
jgi:hypothetical protein